MFQRECLFNLLQLTEIMAFVLELVIELGQSVPSFDELVHFCLSLLLLLVVFLEHACKCLVKSFVAFLTGDLEVEYLPKLGKEGVYGFKMF